MTKNKIIQLKSKEQFNIINLTDEITSFIKQSDIKNGLVNIQSMHTTSAVFVQENEPLLLEDIKKCLNRLVPQNIEYNHDDFGRRTVNLCNDECRNGHSHCKAIFLPTAVCLNLIEGKIQLGTWQKILFIELDRPRDRKIQIQIIGE